MSDLTKKVNYLKGLADGMQMSGDTPEQKLLLQMLDVLESMADEIEEMAEAQEDMEEYLDAIEDDLADLEDAVYENEDDDDFDDDEDDEDDEDEDDEEIGGDSLVEYECPHCGFKTGFDITDFDFEEDYLCPECQQPFFPEHEEEDGEDEGDDNGENAPTTR